MKVRSPKFGIRSLACKGSIAFLLLIASAGCTSIIPSSPKPPQAFDFTLPGTYEEVFEVSLLTLIAEYIPVISESREKGVIQTGEVRIQGREYQAWTQKSGLATFGYGTFTLRFLQDGETRTKLEITSQFQAGRNGLSGSRGAYRESTGVFENQLAARIHAYLILKKYPRILQLATGCNFHWNEEVSHYQVSGVAPNSLGAEQGFQNGDLVIQIDGVDTTMENFFAVLTNANKTERKKFFLDRNGKGVFVEATVYFLPQDLPWYGFTANLDKDAGYFKVTQVAKESPAAFAGFQVGDILLAEEDVWLSNWQDFYRAMTSSKLGADRNFLISREGQEKSLFIPAALTTPPSA